MNNPLVSIVIVSYNSESTIVETLDSIKNQTYKKIELIISDDASSDGTCEIINKWISDNGSNFYGVKTIFSKQNHGVSFNVNEGCKAASGQWIKPIAADDVLYSNAIECYVSYINEIEPSQFVVSNISRFKTNINSSYVDKKSILRQKFFCESDDQKNRILYENPLLAPTFFFSRNLFHEIGGFDLRFRNTEDWPFVIKICNAGIRINLLDCFTVYYRVMESSSHAEDSLFYNISHMNSVETIRSELCDCYSQKLYYKYHRCIKRVRDKIIINLFKNKNNKLNHCIYNCFSLLQPEWWKNRL